MSLDLAKRQGDRPLALMVADLDGTLFERIRALGLDVAVWHIAGDPLRVTLDGASLFVVAADDEPDWDRVKRCVGLAPTIIAAFRPTMEHALEAIRLGAFGYLDAGVGNDALRRTLIRALQDEPVFGRSVLGAWFRRERLFDYPNRGRVEGLTARQHQIVRLIARGSTDRAIGARLGIRTATAQKHVANVLRRLGVRNRAAVVGLMVETGNDP
jgi:DNA-binding CsgD family transcriptional regulator